MPTVAAQALLDAKAALDQARADLIPLKATRVAAQVAEEVQDGIVQAAALAVTAAINALLVESGNVPQE